MLADDELSPCSIVSGFLVLALPLQNCEGSAIDHGITSISLKAPQPLIWRSLALLRSLGAWRPSSRTAESYCSPSVLAEDFTEAVLSLLLGVRHELLFEEMFNDSGCAAHD